MEFYGSTQVEKLLNVNRSTIMRNLPKIEKEYGVTIPYEMRGKSKNYRFSKKDIIILDEYFNGKKEKLENEDPLILCFSNGKGGVGKTETASQTSCDIATFHTEKPVLLVGMDPQREITKKHLPSSFDDKKYNLFSLMEAALEEGEIDFSDYIVEIYPNLYHIPSSLKLGRIDNFEPDELYILQDILKDDFFNMFSLIIIDVVPTVGKILTTSLLASHYTIIPSVPEDSSIEGIDETLKIINNLNKRKHPIKFLGVQFNKLMQNYTIHNDEIENAKEFVGTENVFKSIIPQNVSVIEARTRGQFLIDYDFCSAGNIAYMELAKEIVATLNHEVSNG